LDDLANKHADFGTNLTELSVCVVFVTPRWRFVATHHRTRAAISKQM
jgi:hypothetical protein